MSKPGIRAYKPVHGLARIVSSKVVVASRPRYRGCIAVDETKLSIKGVWVYIRRFRRAYGRSCLNALSILRKALKQCTNIVDRGPWYRWALERLGLEYRHERFGMRNRVERFFRYLKERTIA